MRMVKAETITLIIGIAVVLSIAFIVSGWIKTPTDFTINLNMDENTKDAAIRIAELQEEVTRLQLQKLELEINNSLDQNISYGDKLSCMVGFYNQEWNESSESYYDTDELQYYNSDICYVIK